MIISKRDSGPHVGMDALILALDHIQIVDREKSLKKLYKIILTSAKGGFGKVVSAKARAPNDRVKQRDIVAIKRLPITSLQIDITLWEVACLLLFKHNNVVQFIEAFRLPTELWIVMEYMEGGTLYHAVKFHKFSEPHIAYLSQQILCGLEFLHSHSYGHRDLKSNNIMLSVSGNVKLIDFGACADVSHPRRQTVGTIFWMAPEIILRQPHNEKCDIWSFGIVLLEMYLRFIPYSSSKILGLWKAVCGETIKCLEENKITICKEAYDLCQNCLLVDPKLRPSSAELRKSPFVVNAEKDTALLMSLKTIFISLNMHRSGF
jgi:p21-activated kinase 1